MSALEAQLRTARAHIGAESAPQTDAAHAADVEAERYWSLTEYAQALGESERWVRDHCNGAARDPVLAYSRVGRRIKFSAEDRAENKRRMAVWSETRDAQVPPLQLPTDPRQLSKLLDQVRRVAA